MTKVSLDVYGSPMTWDEMGDLLRGYRDVQRTVDRWEPA